MQNVASQLATAQPHIGRVHTDNNHVADETATVQVMRIATVTSAAVAACAHPQSMQHACGHEDCSCVLQHL
jgi:hypothetical protein